MQSGLGAVQKADIGCKPAFKMKFCYLLFSMPVVSQLDADP